MSAAVGFHYNRAARQCRSDFRYLAGLFWGETEAAIRATEEPLRSLGVLLDERHAVGAEFDFQTTLLTVTGFAGDAENVNQYLNKGARVAVTGRLAVPQWTNNEGEPKSEVVVAANSIYFLDRKPDVPDTRAHVAKLRYLATLWGVHGAMRAFPLA
jgi:hypothetical protein